MEIEKIRNLSDEELKVQQIKSAEELFRLRFRMNLGNAEGVKKLRGLKLDIARIQTVARERDLHIERAAKPQKATKAAAAPAPEENAEGENARPAKKASAKSSATKKAPAQKAAAKKTAKKD